MIIELLCDLVYWLIDTLIVFEFPQLPQFVFDVYEELSTILAGGLCIAGNYLEVGPIMTMMSMVVTVDIAIYAYKTIMWILRKIPLADIS